MVFVPDIVHEGLFGLDKKIAEELAIFILGGIGFAFYLIKEKQLSVNEYDKNRAQREASRTSKDLTSSYSFIGEINRKLEIFKNISLGLPVWSKKTLSMEREVFEYIMSAIKILTKSDEYKLVFINKDSCEERLSIKSKKNIKFKLSDKQCLEENKKYFENNQFIVIISPDDIDGILALMVIKKKKTTQTFDDPDMLKAIATQALFLYIFIERRKKPR